jgi:molecular chaperone DnaK (HSP70)
VFGARARACLVQQLTPALPLSPTQVGKPKVSVTFALDTNGLLDVSKAELALEMLER